MSTHKIVSHWKENMQFQTFDEYGHDLIMDIGENVKGDNAGFRPMQLLLVSLSGCMGVDVKIILNKMKIDIKKLEIEVLGEINDNSKPKTYKKITLNFKFTGSNLSEEKLEKAILLAEEKYCNVSAILSKSSPIEHTITILNE